MNPLANGLVSSSDESIFSPPFNAKTLFNKLVISNPTTGTFNYVIKIKFSSGNVVQHYAGQLSSNETAETLQDVVIINPEQLIVRADVAGKLQFALYGENQAKN